MRIGNIELGAKGKGVLSLFKDYKRHLDILFAIGVLAIVGILIFPIPSWLMDVLLCISITVSVLILMTVLFVEKALDFNSFPSVLLVVTMLRLSLNISSTRLILSNGHTGTSAAGHVIEAFGVFVMQSSVVIGGIVFGILTIINFVVITKGSGRIAEVAARFSLDAMPGKQMAIDADLSAGLIDEETAKQRRKELEAESAFFGSMDGANKFVRGDAIAGLIIIFINLIAGIIIGVVQKGLTFDSAVQTYTLLTIGDGLVAQIPALIVSTAAGLLVTKSAVKGSAEKAILDQLGNFPHALGVTSGLLIAMAMMPMIPAIPFLATGTVAGLLAYTLNKTKTKTAAEGGKDKGGAPAPVKTQEELLNEILQIDILRLELGYELLPLIHYQKGHKITDQVKALRKQVAKDLGFVIPPVRIQDNLQLEPKEYVLKVKDIECARGKVEPNKFLVMDSKGGNLEIAGEDTKEPAFGLAAKWIEEGFKESANFKGYTVVDPPTVIITHLTEIIKDNITELLSASETQKLIDGLSSEHKKLVSDMIPASLTLTGFQRVLQGLLNEGISIRDLPTIVEAMSEVASTTGHVMQLIENVRARLTKQICNMYESATGYVPILVLSPKWEQIFAESLVGNGDEKQLSLAPSQLEEFVKIIGEEYEKQLHKGETPVLLTSAILRPYIRSIVERFKSVLPVISQNEVHPKAKIKTLGVI
jgi:flagellar biosynthesis protein FlhA